MKNNIFVSGLPESYTFNGNEITDKKKIIQEVFERITPNIQATNYIVSKVFDPIEGRTRCSAKVTFNDYESKLLILRNSKNLSRVDSNDTIRKVFIRSEDLPLTSKENKRLVDKMWTLRRALLPNSSTVYKLVKGKLLENDCVIDEFNLNNQIFC